MKEIKKKAKAPEKPEEGLFNDSTKQFGARISELRKIDKLTQAEVAEELGVSDSTISRIERGKQMPPRYLLHSMFQSFGILADEAISMLLDISDHYEDDSVNELRIAVREENYAVIHEIINKNDEKKLDRFKMYHQLFLYAKVLTEPELDVHTAVNRCIEALCVTRKSFNLDNIPKYRLRLDELMIINDDEKKLDRFKMYH